MGLPRETADALQRVLEVLEEHGVSDVEKSEELLRGLAEELGWKAGELFMPIRVGITGSRATPTPLPDNASPRPGAGGQGDSNGRSSFFPPSEPDS